MYFGFLLVVAFVGPASWVQGDFKIMFIEIIKQLSVLDCIVSRAACLLN